MTTASMATKPGTASHGRRRWVTVRFARFLRPKKIFGPAAVTQILPFLVYRREAGRRRRVNIGQTGFSSKVQITKPNTRKNESTDNLTCTGGFREERQNQCKLLAETRVQTNLALGRYSDNSHLVESYRDLESTQYIIECGTATWRADQAHASHTRWRTLPTVYSWFPKPTEWAQIFVVSGDS